MEKIRLQNSFIAYIKYDATQKDLFVTLSSAKQFRYTGVSVGIWQELKRSKSKGNFFTNRIVNNRKYPCEFIGIVPPAIFSKEKHSHFKFLAK